MSSPLRLRTHLFLTLGLLLAVTLALGAVAAFFALGHLFRQRLHEAQREETRALAQVCRQAAVSSNEAPMVAYAQMLGARTGVAYAYFVDRGGVFRVHTDLSFLHRSQREWPLPKIRVVEKSFPVEAGRERLGTAVLGYRQDYLDQMERRGMRFTALALLSAGGVAGILGIVLALVLAQRLARPIQRLARAASTLGKGDLSVRVPPVGSAEVHDLALVFNQMAEGLGELDRVKDDFISMVSHDLRTPLSGVSSYAETLRLERRGPLNDVQKEYLGIIGENADRLGRLVSDILDLAKIKAGRMEYRLARVDLGAALTRTVDLFRMAIEREGGRLEFHGAPGLRVLADEPKLDRVLANLVSNAFKHMAAKDGWVRVSAERVGGNVVFTVADNGPGVPPKDQARIFERFAAVDGSGLVRGQGTGLGLTVVKTFLEAMGGRVWVENGAGGGAVFRAALPAGESA